MTGRPKSSRTSIKICGITSVELAAVAVEAGADAIGLVLAPPSPRCIDRALALEIASSLPDDVAPVVLFQDAEVETVNDWPHPCVQLHGAEDESYIDSIVDHRIVRGFRFDPDQVRRWDACERVDALLIDGSTGGEGEMFDHERLAELMSGISTPVHLAGGLTPDNVAAAIRAVRPFGVDVSSGVESSRGVKDPALIRAFCEAVRDADSP